MKFIYNDGGRKAAGYKDKAHDCVIRAICIASNLNYQDVYDTLYSDKGLWVKDYEPYLSSLGYKWCRLRKGKRIPKQGRYIVRIKGHLFAVIDGVVHDTHKWKQKMFGYYIRG